MKRIIHDEKVTMVRRKYRRSRVWSNKEKQSNASEPLRLLSYNGDLKNISRLKHLKDFKQQSDESNSHHGMQTSTVQLSEKRKTLADSKSSKMISNINSNKRLCGSTVRRGDLRRSLLHMEEKFTSASEELQATEEELTELRVALSNAKRIISALRVENGRHVEKIKYLMAEAHHGGLHKKRDDARMDVRISHSNQSNSPQDSCAYISEDTELCTEDLLKQNRNLKKLNLEITEQVNYLNSALEESKVEVSKLMLENNQLKMTMEEERKDWDRMQKDLLIAVKVANDFKMEAQTEMMRLSEKISELQKRRQSIATLTPRGSPFPLSEEKPQTWEEEAWQRLMVGCERGSRRNALLRWCQQAVAKYPHIEITNFSTSWVDGQALCHLLASFYPDKLDVENIGVLGTDECLKLALSVADVMGVEVKVQVGDFQKDDRPDWSLIMSLGHSSYLAI